MQKPKRVTRTGTNHKSSRVGVGKRSRRRVARRSLHGLRDVTRHVPLVAQCLLWGRSAGRCEFDGCNQPLWESPVTREAANIAQKAHIWSFSGDGPRGNDGICASDLNCIENLMLLCHPCHRKIDQRKDGGQYSAELLQCWKRTHEQRIELVTGIAARKSSHVLLYGANIGAISSPLQFAAVAPVLFPHRYPAEPRAIELGMLNSCSQDRDREFYEVQARNLHRQMQRKVHDRLASGDIEHLSIFGLAPQPLLMMLGTLLTDIPAADVYQLHREPRGWGWASGRCSTEYKIKEPADCGEEPALVLSLSGAVTPDRINSVLGPKAAIWEVTVPEPGNDFLQSREQLQEFRRVMRRLFDRIKAAYGQDAILHVFPAAPVSVAVELGRVHMPKADLRMRVYDQLPERGFVPVLELPWRDV